MASSKASVFPQQDEFLECLAAAVDHASEAKLSRVAELAVQHKQKNYKLVHHHLEKSWSTCKQLRTRRNLLYCISHIVVSARGQLGSASKYGERIKPLIVQVLKSLRETEFKDHAFRTVALWRKRKVFQQTDIEQFNDCLGVAASRRTGAAHKHGMGNASASQHSHTGNMHQQQVQEEEGYDIDMDEDMDMDMDKQAMIKEESEAIAAALISSQQPSNTSNAAHGSKPLNSSDDQLSNHGNGSTSSRPHVTGHTIKSYPEPSAAEMLSALANKLAEATTATPPPPLPPSQGSNDAQVLSSSTPMLSHDQLQTPSYERGLAGMSPTTSEGLNSEQKPQHASLPESYVLSPDKPPPPPPPPPPVTDMYERPQPPPPPLPQPAQPQQVHQVKQATSGIPGISTPQHNPFPQPPFYPQHVPPGLGLPGSHQPLIPGIHPSQPRPPLIPPPPMQTGNGNLPHSQPPPPPPQSLPSYPPPMPSLPVPSSPEPTPPPPPPPPPLPEDNTAQPASRAGIVAGGPLVSDLTSPLVNVPILSATMTVNLPAQPAIPGISTAHALNSIPPWAQAHAHQPAGDQKPPPPPQTVFPDGMHEQIRPPFPPATSNMQAPSLPQQVPVSELQPRSSKRKSRWEQPVQAVDNASDAYDPFGE